MDAAEEVARGGLPAREQGCLRSIQARKRSTMELRAGRRSLRSLCGFGFRFELGGVSILTP